MGTRSLLLTFLASFCMVGFARLLRGEGPAEAVVTQYCTGCHNNEKKKGELDLESVASDNPARHPEIWEKVIRRMRARQMPPADKKRPDDAKYNEVLGKLEKVLDGAATEHPNPGRTETFRRLTRTEYQNAIRDLLALDIDATALLPKDDDGLGFDNVAVGTLSPTLLDRYISAAQKISSLALGAARRPGGDTFRIRADVTQEEHVTGLPPGTRGGTLINYTFPQDAEYDFQIRLARDRNEEVEGLHEPHQLELLLDGERAQSFTVAPAKDKNYEAIDRHLKFRMPVTAGPHKVGVTFVKNPSELLETRREPYNAHFNMHRHPRIGPAVYQVSINGPYDPKGPGDTPSRRRIFGPELERQKPERILLALMRRAYRRPVTDADLVKPMEFFRAEKDFDAGIQSALSAILVSPQFLFRVEHEPARLATNSI